MIAPNQKKASFVNIWEGLQNLLMQLLGSKAFTGENNLLPIFLKVLIEMEPDFSTQLGF